MDQNTNNTMPNKAIAVLIIVALLVTIISTWVILGAINTKNIQTAQTKQTSSVSDGDIVLKVLAPINHQKADTGKVTLNVEKSLE